MDLACDSKYSPRSISRETVGGSNLLYSKQQPRNNPNSWGCTNDTTSNGRGRFYNIKRHSRYIDQGSWAVVPTSKKTVDETMIGVIRCGYRAIREPNDMRLAAGTSSYSDAHDTLGKQRQVNLRTDYNIIV